MLAEHGYTALCVEYFGAPGVPDALDDPDEPHEFGGTTRANAHAPADAWETALGSLRLIRAD